MSMTEDMFSTEVPDSNKNTGEGGITLSDDQVEAIETICNNPNNNYYITGAAGSGKSTVLRELKRYLKNYVVCAPTGLAALNVGGQTLHSTFKIPPRVVTRRDAKLIEDPNSLKFIRMLKHVIIEEISMVRADILDLIDEFLKINCGNSKPFGGKQVIFFGDLDQLPPVVSKNEADIIYDMYNSPYFFSAKALKTGNFVAKYLSTIHRQSDPEFINLLNAVKKNDITDEQLDFLNERVGQGSDDKIYITSTNELAESINHDRLAKLETPEFVYHGSITGEYSSSLTVAPAELRLKVGAKVIHLANNNSLGIYNGTRGTVVELDKDSIVIKFDGVEMPLAIGRYTWENKKFKFRSFEEKITENTVGEYCQYPLKLGWASTVHKSQGQTYDSVHINLGNGAFAAGMSYVALSRCRSLSGITLERPFTRRDIIVDQAVANFYKSFEKQFVK